ncbi:cytochrome-c oxidase, cbb3-type subunit III [Pontivivens insulae]|uniref:Cbb3-type cytochrome c oxidase subunit n=1 Tax=Pontivivens insulae TaxID=1639689 RepID=A0A2R8AFM6_9RHOB|nr:cytochrome-c oxidase, cbb3-type subunit III [Pontivivens insulae]RED12230.1 cytochrome c oxidase cbb3-type subunit 3 [Pontivivens insulae]SPF30986.1 Cbb3-type cytochrome c oxidase subunit CcoP [Pontivivens insulae]
MSDDQRRVDEISGTETTGHSWDGIEELNTPLPRWWLWTFYACIAFSAVYVVLFPAIPLVNEATQGVLGWSSRGNLSEELDEVAATNLERTELLQAVSIEDAAADPSLRAFAIAGGRAAFQVNCVQCHGSGAAGGAGYPNLNDDDWLWGGSLAQIEETLLYGIRHDQYDFTRWSEMPAFGAGILTRAEISDVAWHVLDLAGLDVDDVEAAARGATLYYDQCASCHGDIGEGMDDLGAPTLNDAIWLFGDTHADIAKQITAPRHGVMPGWQDRLGEATVRQLAIYVHGLGGGE